MTETEADDPRPRRRGGSRGQPARDSVSPDARAQPSRGKRCIREGCTRRVRNGEWDTCCHLCRFLIEELDRAQRVCQALGPDGADYWSSAVVLSDSLTEYYRSELRIYQAARSVGITEAQWHAIKRGQQEQ